MTYEKLQAAQWAWASERFGDERSATAALAPLAGVVEEIGELHEANGDPSAIEDAIGDCVIYLSDLCSRMDWTLHESPAVSMKLRYVLTEEWKVLLVSLGRLAHAVLKTSQGIRKGEDHDANGQQAVADLMAWLSATANIWHLGDALSCAEAAWAEVSQRSAGHAAIPGGGA